MIKIREEAEHDLKWSRVWPEDDHLERQSKRVLLLDKAYRYQRAAYKMNDLCWWFDGDCMAIKLYNKVQHCKNKAASLYKQAEEL